MRQRLVAGNWKMNGSLAGARTLVGAIVEGAAGGEKIFAAVMFSFTPQDFGIEPKV